MTQLTARRRWAVAAAMALMTAAAATVAAATPQTAATHTPPDTGTSVYRKVLASSVWIHSERGRGRLATGSGSLIDRGRRLVLTNYHVVGNVPQAMVFFPVYDRSGRAVPERAFYLARKPQLAIRGEVIERDKEADLALIRLERVPAGVPALKLAAASPEPGQNVHSIGNPGKSDALWVYTPGKVRQVYTKKWKARLDDTTVVTFQAKVIETDSPTNPGDSGGPLVNDQAELVGVTQGGALDAQLISIFVDVSEVRRLVHRRSVQSLRSDEPEELTPRRTQPLPSRDGGEFFSPKAWSALQQTAETLLRRKGIDLVVETYARLPDSAGPVAAELPAKEREPLFRRFARQRAQTLQLNGVYILICRTPSYLLVERFGTTPGLPDGLAAELSQTLLAAFRKKDYDDGLLAVVRQLRVAAGLPATDGP